MTRTRVVLLLVTVSLGAGLFESTARATVFPVGGKLHGAVLALLPSASFEQAMAVPELRALARTGGAGLMTTRVGSGDPAEAAVRAIRRGVIGGPADGRDLAGIVGTGTFRCMLTDVCDRPVDLYVLDLRRMSLISAARQLQSALSHRPFRDLVVAVSTQPSPAMGAAGDEVTPILVSAPRQLINLSPVHVSMRGLTSDTTRQDGLVANVDVAPTILRALGVPIPSAMQGQPIRVIDAPAPFALHRLELEQRRTRLPIQFAELAFVVLAALIGAWALIVVGRGGELSPGVRSFVRAVALAGVSLQPALLLAGALPHRSYAWMVPGILVAMALLTAIGIREWSGPDPIWPFTVIGAISLAILAVNLTIQGLALRVPLFGGTMFDGVRFYGLPNAFLPVLLGGAVLVAAVTSPFNGFAVLVAAGLAAGLPGLGADLGGSITLFFAAGLWLVLRTRPRVAVRELAMIAGVTVAGFVVVVAANRWAPGVPTHVGRFVEGGSGVGGAFHVLADHLAVGARMIAEVPAAVLPLMGFVLIGVLVLRRTGSVGEGMRTDDRWPGILLTICAASLMAYVVNDTGAAAADPALVYAMAGITYPAMMVARRRTRAVGSEESPATEVHT